MHPSTDRTDQQPYSRRTLTGMLAASLAFLTAPFATRTAARQATPVATPASLDAEREFLFVQTFGPGTWAPKEGDPELYTLTVTQGTSETIFFSDRPERIVGTVPTTQFLEELGFTPYGGPNAAVVAGTGNGEAVLVVVLSNPVYDERDGLVTITYDARLLEEYEETGLAYLADQQTDDGLPETLETVSLFIDDCRDINVCLGGTPPQDGGSPAAVALPAGSIPTCWDWKKLSCQPCNGNTRKYYREMCDEAFPELCAQGGCLVGND